MPLDEELIGPIAFGQSRTSQYHAALMRDDAPASIGPYAVTREIGRGGMGVVYLAHDPRLDRQVAIKALPAGMADDADRLERFEREARTLAALNHPNIASIYGVEYADGRPYLVLEYVEGETLEDRLTRGPLPLPEALSVAGQLAEAVEAAHESGIIHRDLKPANIKFAARHDGDDRIKVLDFGLAKALEHRPPEPVEDAGTSTLVMRGCPTAPGMILGTPGYLSPEQARGYPVDRRSDIFSFGCLLYEMLTGRCAFGGSTASDSIATLLEKEPDWEVLPPRLPASIQRLLRRCLVKDRRQRQQSMGDVRLELEEARDTTGADGVRDDSPRRPLTTWAPWLVAGVLGVAFVLVVMNRSAPSPPPAASPQKWEVTLPDDATLGWAASSPTSLSAVGYSRQIALSSDGTRLVCTGQRGSEALLYFKGPDRWALEPIPGTENARAPFFSPDGESIGFLQDGVLKRVRLPHSPPLTICRVISTGFDATWGTADTIIYAADDGLWRVADDGMSDPQPLEIGDPERERNHYRFPHISLDGRWLFLTIVNESGVHAAMASLVPGDSTWHVIRREASDARYVSSGHLVFAQQDVIHAARFDPSRPEDVAVAAPIAFGVHTTPGHYGLLVTHFATSSSTALAFAPGVEPPEDDTLLWVDPDRNQKTVITGGAGKWRHPRLSPDGDRVLFDIQGDDGRRDLYIYDLGRRQQTQLTFRGSCFNAEWSPDGRSIAYCAGGPDGRAVYRVATDFSGEDSMILPSRRGCWPHLAFWTKDGETLLFWERARGGTWMLPLDGAAELTAVVHTHANERWAVVSPEGDLIAYVADEQGAMEVFVQPYPSLGQRVRVSNGGGGEPIWLQRGEDLMLYFRHREKLFRSKIDSVPEIVAHPPELVHEGSYDLGPPGHQHYDVAPDGRLLMITEGRRSRPGQIRVIDNWPARLARDGDA